MSPPLLVLRLRSIGFRLICTKATRGKLRSFLCYPNPLIRSVIWGIEKFIVYPSLSLFVLKTMRKQTKKTKAEGKKLHDGEATPTWPGVIRWYWYITRLMYVEIYRLICTCTYRNRYRQISNLNTKKSPHCRCGRQQFAVHDAYDSRSRPPPPVRPSNFPGWWRFDEIDVNERQQ